MLLLIWNPVNWSLLFTNTIWSYADHILQQSTKYPEQVDPLSIRHLGKKKRQIIRRVYLQTVTHRDESTVWIQSLIKQMMFYVPDELRFVFFVFFNLLLFSSAFQNTSCISLHRYAAQRNNCTLTAAAIACKKWHSQPLVIEWPTTTGSITIISNDGLVKVSFVLLFLNATANNIELIHDTSVRFCLQKCTIQI